VNFFKKHCQAFLLGHDNLSGSFLNISNKILYKSWSLWQIDGQWRL